jgi:hypothetical protein
MLEKQTWIYLLINCIVTTAIILILFRFQENKIKTLLKKQERYNKKNNFNHNNHNNNINKFDMGNIKDNNVNTEETENTENNKINNDIDSFIDPIENNNTN